MNEINFTKCENIILKIMKAIVKIIDDESGKELEIALKQFNCRGCFYWKDCSDGLEAGQLPPCNYLPFIFKEKTKK